jgi:phosphoribosylformylglycinamidine synthase
MQSPHKKRIGVVVFPGSNCDQDMVDALALYEQCEVVKLWHKETDIQGVDMIVLPGGFSYGDYLRSGAIARFSPIMQEVMRFAAKGGFVFGVCNGFQILAEAGLVPGALLANSSHKFMCKNVCLQAAYSDTPITSNLSLDELFHIPIAHGEGRYYADERVLEAIETNHQVIFRYAPSSDFDQHFNPNGSLNNIAGVCNKAKNVFGMMPHPERAADPILGNNDGRRILDTLVSSTLEVDVTRVNIYSTSM